MRGLVGGIVIALQLAALAEVPSSYAGDSHQKLRTATYELASSDIAVRANGLHAILELSRTDAPAAESAKLILLALLNDRIADYRVMAAMTLVDAADERALGPAVRVLVEDLWNGHEPRKALIVRYLKKAGTKEALEALREYEKPWWKIW